MKKQLLIILLFPFFVFSQSNVDCEKEIIEQDNYYYEGCLNYEGEPEGQGYEKINSSTQTQIKSGYFKNGQFYSGEFVVEFESGDKRKINYLDYANKLMSNEIYEWSDGDKKQTFYKSGKKIKEIQTHGPGDQEGLIIERLFRANQIIETRNTSNNRVPEDIVGDKESIKIKLIENQNKFRIPIEFIQKDGSSFTVPIQFDTGATGFLIGYKLYQDLLEKCEIVDLNVKSQAGGVGSKFITKYIKIKKLKIGDYLIKNVVAFVPISKDSDGNYINDMLLGIGFLRKFNEVSWSLNNNVMTFSK
ncbi:aspartyl protease family protein [Flavobacteriaceae bacterium]|nr:aspartyl protease family protein [Flavobacteriaceae bacterium]